MQTELEAHIPEKWRQKYVVKRINGEDLEVDLKSRNALLEAIRDGMRFFQVGKYTLMVNSIQAIEPKWGEVNIPPRPEKKWGDPTQPWDSSVEQQEWDKVFGDQIARLK